jgi:hypothetical protein
MTSVWTGESSELLVNPKTTLKRQVFTATQGQNLFTLTEFNYVAGMGALIVVYNGDIQNLSTDYIEFSASSVQLNFQCNAGDTLLVLGFVGITASIVDVKLWTNYYLAGTGDTLIPTSASYVPGTGSTGVYKDGLKLNAGIDYIELVNLPYVNLVVPAVSGQEYSTVVGKQVNVGAVDSTEVGFTYPMNNTVPTNLGLRNAKLAYASDFEINAVDTIENISKMRPNADGVRFRATRYYNSTQWKKGGGQLEYDITLPKSLHDGGMYFSPTVPNLFLATEAGLINYLAGSGETNPTGYGVFKRVEVVKVMPSLYGAKVDGLADDITPVKRAIKYLKEDTLYWDSGITRITTNIDEQSAPRINAVGTTHGVYSHTSLNVAQLNNDPLYRITGNGTPGASTQATDAQENRWILGVVGRGSVVKCDGCNLIGAADVGSVLGCLDNRLASLRNTVVWGVNNASMGIYHMLNTDTIVENNTFVLFKDYGYCQRGGIVTVIKKNGWVDCGWGREGTGDFGYPNTHDSGCAIKLVSNMTAGDFVSIDPNQRVTSFVERNNFVYPRAHTIFNKSGYRGIQASGVLAIKSEPEGYTGSFYNICLVDMPYYYIENYGVCGTTLGDNKPKALFMLNSIYTMGVGYAVNNSVGSVPAIDRLDSGVVFLSNRNGFTGESGNPTAIGPSYSKIDELVTLGTPGTTQQVVIPYINKISAGPGLSSGIMGLIMLQLTSLVDGNNYTRTVGLAGIHRGSTNHAFSQAPIYYENPTGILTFKVGLTYAFVGTDLIITIDWGSAWGAGSQWQLNGGLFAIKTISA